ncbi:MAG: hypothetical protein ACPH51_06310, partial [Luminiphilus sp.]
AACRPSPVARRRTTACGKLCISSTSPRTHCPLLKQHSQRLQQDAPALLETLPLLPDLILNRLRQTPRTAQNPPARASQVLPLATLGALALGLGIAGSGTGWLILGGGCLLGALFIRNR